MLCGIHSHTLWNTLAVVTYPRERPRAVHCMVGTGYTFNSNLNSNLVSSSSPAHVLCADERVPMFRTWLRTRSRPSCTWGSTFTSATTCAFRSSSCPSTCTSSSRTTTSRACRWGSFDDSRSNCWCRCASCVKKRWCPLNSLSRWV